MGSDDFSSFNAVILDVTLELESKLSALSKTAFYGDLSVIHLSTTATTALLAMVAVLTTRC